MGIAASSRDMTEFGGLPSSSRDSIPSRRPYRPQFHKSDPLIGFMILHRAWMRSEFVVLRIPVVMHLLVTARLDKLF